jgi:hypothetical protein
MHRKVDVAIEQRRFDFQREHAFAANNRQRLALLLIARGADDALFDT